MTADAGHLSPDAWYNCSRGARVVMLAKERAKAMIINATRVLEDEDAAS